MSEPRFFVSDLSLFQYLYDQIEQLVDLEVEGLYYPVEKDSIPRGQEAMSMLSELIEAEQDWAGLGSASNE